MNFEVPKNFELVTDKSYVIQAGDRFVTQRIKNDGEITYSGWRGVSSSIGRTVAEKEVVSKNIFKLFARSTIKTVPFPDTNPFSKLQKMFDAMDGISAAKEKKPIKKQEKQDTSSWPEPPDGYIFEDDWNYVFQYGDKFISDKNSLKYGTWDTINSFRGNSVKSLKKKYFYDVLAVAIKGEKPVAPRFKTDKPYPFGY